MNDDRRLERQLTAVFDETAPPHEPEHLLADVLSIAGRVRQRRHWLASLKEPPMRYRSQLVVGSPTLRATAVLAVAAALLLALAGVVVAGASLLPGPAVVPGPQNGPIAFDAEGDIWTVNGDGSDFRRLTETPEAEHSPMWSPDGARVAYWVTPDGVAALAIRAADGALEKIITPASGVTLSDTTSGPCTAPVQWSPDGRSLAATALGSDGPAIAIVDVATGTVRPLDVDMPACGFAWSPDGSSIAFQGGQGASAGLYAVSPDGSGLRRITAEGARVVLRGDNGNAFTPDGRSLVYDLLSPGALDSDVATVGVDGSSARVIVAGQTFDFNGSVSPDGRSVAFLRRPEGSGDGRDAYVVDIDGSGLRQVGQDVCVCSLIWSPDGTRLATWTPGSFDDVVVLTVDGSAPRVQIPSPRNAGSLSWTALTTVSPAADPEARSQHSSARGTSPSGAAVFAFSNNLLDGGNVYTMRADGTDLRHIGPGFDPTWSPDGSAIAFYRYASGYDRVDLMVADAAGVSTVATEVGLCWADLLPLTGPPVWSADSRFLVYPRLRVPYPDCEAMELWVIAADGSVPVHALLAASFPGASQVAAWSPSGRRVALRGTDRDGPGLFLADVVDPATPSGLEPRRLSQPGVTGWDHIQWSPDETEIATHASADAVVVDIDGAGLTALMPGGVAGAFPMWSPDGAHLSLVSRSESKLAPSEGYLIDPDGGDERPIAAPPLDGWCCGSLVFSPDGTRVLGRAPAKTSNKISIPETGYVITLDGSMDPIAIQARGYDAPSWQPVVNPDSPLGWAPAASPIPPIE